MNEEGDNPDMFKILKDGTEGSSDDSIKSHVKLKRKWEKMSTLLSRNFRQSMASSKERSTIMKVIHEMVEKLNLLEARKSLSTCQNTRSQKWTGNKEKMKKN